MMRYERWSSAAGLNWYLEDPNLVGLIHRQIPEEDRAWAVEKLSAMGQRMGAEVEPRAEQTDRHPPALVRWSARGDEINRVEHPSTSLLTKRDLWRANFLHLPRSEEARARGRPVPGVLMMAYRYLLSQAETGMLCSIGMTTGVLRLVEKYGSKEAQDLFLPKLLLNDFDQGWDGSMYLTERAGGSDVGATETRAELVDGTWRLYGLKWFCSNVDGRAIVTLARPEGAPAGVKGLALFAVPKTWPDGSANGVHIRRIKDKLGTRAVPTGEIDLAGARGFLLAGPEGNALDGRGINRMMEFVSDSRLGVAAMGAGIARRVFLEAAIYACQRRAFGRRIDQYGMVRDQLLELMVASEAAAALLFFVASHVDGLFEALPGRERLVRILVPLAKMRCARTGLSNASSAMEVMGGNGYIEDWPLARQLRDAQAHTIWEGSENILALDVLRAMKKERGDQAVLEELSTLLDRVRSPLLTPLKRDVQGAVGRLSEACQWVERAQGDRAEAKARRLANLFADVVQAVLLLHEAQDEVEHQGSARKALVAARFVDLVIDPAQARGVMVDDGMLEAAFEPLLDNAPVSVELARRSSTRLA